MAAKIKLTKNELKRQKEGLKRFRRYLPMLELKKKQIQTEINKIKNKYNELEEEKSTLNSKINSWIAVFGEKVSFEEILVLKKVNYEIGNIAGVDIPIFLDALYEIQEYDLFAMPFWIDHAVEEVKKLIDMKIQLKTLLRQIELLAEELRVTTQRVNLFEKIKIPESRENIRVIQIHLGDEQTAGVVRGKIAKTKLISSY